MSSNVSNRGPRPGVSRGKYNKIDIAIKERLIQAFENGSDWKEAADTLNIKESTARSIILRHCEEDSVEDRRGGRIKRWSSEIYCRSDWKNSCDGRSQARYHIEGYSRGVGRKQDTCVHLHYDYFKGIGRPFNYNEEVTCKYSLCLIHVSKFVLSHYTEHLTRSHW